MSCCEQAGNVAGDSKRIPQLPGFGFFGLVDIALDVRFCARSFASWAGIDSASVGGARGVFFM